MRMFHIGNKTVWFGTLNSRKEFWKLWNTILANVSLSILPDRHFWETQKLIQFYPIKTGPPSKPYQATCLYVPPQLFTFLSRAFKKKWADANLQWTESCQAGTSEASTRWLTWTFSENRNCHLLTDANMNLPGKCWGVKANNNTALKDMLCGGVTCCIQYKSCINITSPAVTTTVSL